MIPTANDLLRILPEVVLAGFGILVMMLEPFLGRGGKRALGPLAFLGTVAALAATVIQAGHQGYAFGRLLVVDTFSVYLHFLLISITGLSVLASLRYLERENIDHAEFYALLLFGAVGMGIMVSANELVMVFLGLETSSLASYVLVGFRRTDGRATEGAMKYFLLGSFATGFLLYGIALLFGAAGSTVLNDLAEKLQANSPGFTLALMGMALFFVGLGFKVAVAPFQAWTPDVYQGAPSPVTAFLSTGPKAAAFAVLLRVFWTAFEPATGIWFWLLWGTAALTMFVGNLGALVQTNVKRMLAYSSIAHAGYILVAFAAGNELGVAAALFYLIAYALMKLGAFSVVAHLSVNEDHQSLEDYSGLHTRQPALAACLTVFLLSLIGLPLTGGFLGKFFVFQAALRAGLVWLVVLGVLNSILSVPYYLRVVKVMYMGEPRESAAPLAPVPASLAFVLTLTALGTVYLGILPDAVQQFVTSSVLSLTLP
ncbi:MAG TPA: NADH-quinone oxidoreductase subunit N [Candidatus Xenobia bacterium]|nr:NADH-quinone oxidoreductase subunit N [Candidatus Xenobia bacterium]